MPQGTPYVAGFIVVAALAAILAVLYAFGVIGFFSSDPGDPHHYKHAAVLGAVAVVSLVGANFARPRTA
jgi:hypothetical protein